MNQYPITLEGEELLLLPERAVWWPSKRTIILSDIHWGKSAHFRKHGIAMPVSTQQSDAKRMAELVARYHAERLIIAGDLFHSLHNKEVDDFGRWRFAHRALHIDFIIGNHDILPESFYAAQALTVHREGLLVHPFYISHDVLQNASHFTIHGHIHPGVRITTGMPGTLPAFCINQTCLVLPAFGRFTGFKAIRLEDYHNVFVIGEGKVMRLKGI